MLRMNLYTQTTQGAEVRQARAMVGHRLHVLYIAELHNEKQQQHSGAPMKRTRYHFHADNCSWEVTSIY